MALAIGQIPPNFDIMYSDCVIYHLPLFSNHTPKTYRMQRGKRIRPVLIQMCGKRTTLKGFEFVGAALELKKMREHRLDWSMRKFANELGLKGSSSYQRYEDETTYPDRLPDKLVSKLLEILPGKGNPPIDFDEVLRLGRLHKIVINNEPQGILLSGVRGILPKTAPLISVDQIEMLQGKGNVLEGEVERFSIGEQYSDDAFWLTVTDAAMSPEIDESDLIACDPRMDPRPGDIVLVKVANEFAAVIRRYRKKEVRPDGAEVIEFFAANPSYATFIIERQSDAKIYGTIVQHLRTLRK